MTKIPMSKGGAISKLNKKVNMLTRQVQRARPEVIWYCDTLNQSLTGAYLFEPTENLRASGVVGSEIRLLSFEFRWHIECPGNTATDHVNYRVIVAKSKVGALTASDFPTTVYGCVDLDDKVVYHDRVYGSHANYINGTTHSGFNQPSGYIKKSYKTGLLTILDEAVDLKNALYVMIIADNYSASANAEGQFLMKYHDN